MAINLHIGMIFLKEKELYEKTMDEIYAKDIFNSNSNTLICPTCG